MKLQNIIYGHIKDGNTPDNDQSQYFSQKKIENHLPKTMRFLISDFFIYYFFMNL